ncbi:MULTISPECIES: ABC transporter ATP-binding protein [unclassified Pseudofrankia]|uniref:ABC transporter ATP-binding protein n=1 Tax=unclassified Pseudofrankia TaxID=2994372 RepID=UPI0008DA47CA|nr:MULTISPECIES: ABC transporter ATP-binding protein [unclassified Pseudofrankia]MDT3444398.1 ABC transporter ATP-binding protein [Pseudofrankia sp. BMG5.37]OHV56472.1 ABC transporter ATP-binding protein [Pseudofrankia sp. BMG5.36]
MSSVSLKGLTKRFDGKPPTHAMKDLDFDIEEGEFIALLGPSGCGKTTTLRCVAGLETPTRGQITIGDRAVFDSTRRINVPPDKRKIGMVFQSYALWPHMSVRKNIAYPLKARGLKQAIAQGRVEETARLVECEELLDRLPMQLSGGQQQRVALARALAARPEVILFDEPLSNLDARLRDQMRSEIHELHRRAPFTAIFVTHDQSEALALGQRIAIMRAGAIEQLDTPQRVFEAPATEYVAAFIGMSNRLELRRTDTGWTCGGQPLEGLAPDAADATVVARFSPDAARLAKNLEEIEAHETALPVQIVDVEFGGRQMNVTATAAATRVRVHVSADRDSWTRRITPDDRLVLAFAPRSAAMFPAEPAQEPNQAEAAPAVAGV